MKLFLIFITLTLLCSCATKHHLDIQGDTFSSVYRPYNTHGGANVLNFALEARDATVDGIRAKGHNVSMISFTDATISYSLSGYYTFRLKGELEYSTSLDDVVLIDRTDLIDTAIKRAHKNVKVGMIISPTTTLLESLMTEKYQPKYIYLNANDSH